MKRRKKTMMMKPAYASSQQRLLSPHSLGAYSNALKLVGYVDSSTYFVG